MDFLIFGTVWFWILTIISIGFIIYFLESSIDDYADTGGGFQATVVLVLFILAYYFLGSREHVVDILTYVKHHTGIIGLLFASYLVLGVIWSFFKWYFFLLNKRDKYREKIADGYKQVNINDYIPSAKNNKSRIMSWMMYWPMSGLWTLINDPVRRAFQFLYNRVESYFDRMSKSLFSEDRMAYEKIEEEKKNKK